MFARALDEQALTASQFHVVDAMGVEAPIAIDLFYGNGSHVVHVRPTSDLLDDEVYVVSVDAGVRTIHGESLAGWSFTFSTGIEGPPPIQGDDSWDDPDGYGDEASSSSGGPDSETGASSGVGAGTSGGDGSTSTGEASDASGVPDARDPAGCACGSGASHPWEVALAWLLLAGARRRRR